MRLNLKLQRGRSIADELTATKDIGLISESNLLSEKNRRAKNDDDGAQLLLLEVELLLVLKLEIRAVK